MASRAALRRPYCIREYVRLQCRTAECEPGFPGMGDALGNRSIIGRRDVRTADSNMFGIHERTGKISQPVRVGVGIIVNVRDDFSRSFVQSRIACGRESAIFGCYHSEAIAMGNLCSRIRGAIVHHDHLVVRILKS